MNFHRLFFCLAMLLCSTLDAAAASGYSDLAVHGQELDSDTSTKKLLRKSVAKQDDDEERHIWPWQTEKALESLVTSLKALKTTNASKDRKAVENILESFAFKNWSKHTLKANPKGLSPRYDALIAKLDTLNAKDLIRLGLQSKDTKVKKIAEELQKEQFRVWKSGAEPKELDHATSIAYSSWKMKHS